MKFSFALAGVVFGISAMTASSQGAWIKINPAKLSNVGRLVITPDGALTVTDESAHAFYQSTDAGKTWSGKDSADGGPAFTVRGEKTSMLWLGQLAARTSDDLFLTGFAVGANAGYNAVFRSRDHGATWSCVTDSLRGDQPGLVVTAPNGDVWIGTIDSGGYAVKHLSVSENNGASWKRILDFAYIDNLVFDPEGTIYLSGIRSGRVLPHHVFRSRNAGVTWDSLPYNRAYDTAGTYIKSVAANRKGEVLLGLSTMAFQFFGSPNDTLKGFEINPAKKSVLSCAISPDSRPVLGIEDHGIYFSNPDVTAFSPMNTGLGTDSTYVYNLEYDSQGNLFALSKGGLYVLRVGGESVHRPPPGSFSAPVFATKAWIDAQGRRYPKHAPFGWVRPVQNR